MGHIYVINIEGFLGNDRRLIPKEIAIVSLTDEYSDHWILEPPYWYRTLESEARDYNEILRTSVHGLHWEEGDVPYSWVFQRLYKLSETANRIYVYGKMQYNFLRDIMPCKLINLYRWVPPLNTLPGHGSVCLHHGINLKEKYVCSLEVAQRLKHYIWRKRLQFHITEETIALTLSPKMRALAERALPTVPDKVPARMNDEEKKGTTETKEKGFSRGKCIRDNRTS